MFKVARPVSWNLNPGSRSFAFSCYALEIIGCPFCGARSLRRKESAFGRNPVELGAGAGVGPSAAFWFHWFLLGCVPAPRDIARAQRNVPPSPSLLLIPPSFHPFPTYPLSVTSLLRASGLSLLYSFCTAEPEIRALPSVLSSLSDGWHAVGTRHGHSSALCFERCSV